MVRDGEWLVPTNQQTELQRLRERVEELEKALAASQLAALEGRARLGVIAKIVRDDARCMRAPSVSFGAVRAALFAERPGKMFDGW
ncbi:hypothetical protein [Micromonospora zhanjiangensis]|uniref:Uncharacterized protein n=1 Tax=Micromonospora zhanjiangensis TaxID=1522057 RepID=A0ABV8KQ89_9ACTN